MNSLSKLLKFKNATIIGVSVLFLILLFTNVKGDFSEGKCNSIEINIEQPENMPLISKNEVMAWLTSKGDLIGERIDKIELSEIEKGIRALPRIKSCEIHIDFKGKLAVDIEPYLPIARVLRDAQTDSYVSKEGVFFPMSPNHTARVILLSGEYFDNKNSLNSQKDSSLVAFLNIINNDDLWRAQFTQIEVKSDKTLEIVPLLGNHLINFGSAENVNAKLRRLSVFYKQIYPIKGWDNFSEVSVAYAHQIVCK